MKAAVWRNSGVRAQIEMIGLVIVVIIIVIGIAIYARSSGTTHSSVQVQVQSGTSFLTALAETDVPDCGVSFSILASECAVESRFCGDPCAHLQRAMSAIASATLLKEGRSFNLSLEGTGVQFFSHCDSGEPTTKLIAKPPLPIAATGRSLVLSLCR
jgi:hypothetical protein